MGGLPDRRALPDPARLEVGCAADGAQAASRALPRIYPVNVLSRRLPARAAGLAQEAIGGGDPGGVAAAAARAARYRARDLGGRQHMRGHGGLLAPAEPWPQQTTRQPGVHRVLRPAPGKPNDPSGASIMGTRTTTDHLHIACRTAVNISSATRCVMRSTRLTITANPSANLHHRARPDARPCRQRAPPGSGRSRGNPTRSGLSARLPRG